MWLFKPCELYMTSNYCNSKACLPITTTQGHSINCGLWRQVVLIYVYIRRYGSIAWVALGAAYSGPYRQVHVVFVYKWSISAPEKCYTSLSMATNLSGNFEVAVVLGALVS